MKLYDNQWGSDGRAVGEIRIGPGLQKSGVLWEEGQNMQVHILIQLT